MALDTRDRVTVGIRPLRTLHNRMLAEARKEGRPVSELWTECAQATMKGYLDTLALARERREAGNQGWCARLTGIDIAGESPAL